MSRIQLVTSLALAFGLVVATGCDEEKPDTPEIAALKAGCKFVLRHLVEISPQRHGADPDSAFDELPIEDLQACMATDPKIRFCLGVAQDIAAVKKCLPRE